MGDQEPAGGGRLTTLDEQLRAAAELGVVNEELVEDLNWKNEGLRQSVGELEQIVEQMKEDYEAHLRSYEDQVASYQAQVEALRQTQTAGAAQDRQVREYQKAVQMLTDYIVELQNKHNEEQLETVPKQQFDEMSEYASHLAKLCEEQERLNTQHVQVQDELKDIQDKISRENATLQAEKQVLEDAMDMLTDHVVEEKVALQQQIEHLLIEQEKLETMLQDRPTEQYFPPLRLEQTKASQPREEALPAIALVTDSEEYVQLQNRYTALQIKYGVLAAREERMKAFEAKEHALLERLDQSQRASESLKESLASKAAQTRELEEQLRDKQQQVNAMLELQNDLTLSPPTICALELRCTQQACSRLQNELLKHEVEAMDSDWLSVFTKNVTRVGRAESAVTASASSSLSSESLSQLLPSRDPTISLEQWRLKLRLREEAYKIMTRNPVLEARAGDNLAIQEARTKQCGELSGVIYEYLKTSSGFRIDSYWKTHRYADQPTRLCTLSKAATKAAKIVIEPSQARDLFLSSAFLSHTACTTTTSSLNS